MHILKWTGCTRSWFQWWKIGYGCVRFYIVIYVLTNQTVIFPAYRLLFIWFIGNSTQLCVTGVSFQSHGESVPSVITRQSFRSIESCLRACWTCSRGSVWSTGPKGASAPIFSPYCYHQAAGASIAWFATTLWKKILHHSLGYIHSPHVGPSCYHRLRHCAFFFSPLPFLHRMSLKWKANVLIRDIPRILLHAIDVNSRGR